MNSGLKTPESQNKSFWIRSNRREESEILEKEVWRVKF
jgi:hypothetical protein